MTTSKKQSHGDDVAGVVGGGTGAIAGGRLGADMALLGPDGTRNTVRYANMNVSRAKPNSWITAGKVISRTPGVRWGTAGGLAGAAGLGYVGYKGGRAAYREANKKWKKQPVTKGLSANQIKGLQDVLQAGRGGFRQSYAFMRLSGNDAGKRAAREIAQRGIAGKPEVKHHIGGGQRLREMYSQTLDEINADTRIAREQKLGTNVVPFGRKRNPRRSKTITIGVNKSLRDKVNQAREHDISGKAVVAGAVGGALALKGAHNAALFAQASRNRKILSNPIRARRLAETLNSKDSKALHDVNMARPSARRKPINNKAYREARAENGDVKRLTRPVNDWSRNMRNVREYRRQLDNPKRPGVIQAVVNPKARYWHQARTLQQVQQAAPKTDKVLYRATDLPPGKDFNPGGEMNTGRLSSWTSDKHVADMFSDKQQTRAKLHRTVSWKPQKWKKHRARAAAPKGSTPALLRMEPGSSGSLNIGPASRHFAQAEWLSGGKVGVKRVSTDERGRKVIDLADVGKRDYDYSTRDKLNPTKHKPLTDDEIAHKKRIQALTSTATGSLGLAALGGTLLATGKGQRVLRAGFKAAGGKKVPKHLVAEKQTPGLRRTITPMLATSAGIGSLGAFNFAAYTRAEADKEKKVSKAMTASPFGVDHGYDAVEKGFGSGFVEGAKKVGRAMGVGGKTTKPKPVTPPKTHSYANNDTPLFGNGPKAAAAPKHKGMASYGDQQTLPGMPKPKSPSGGGSSSSPFGVKQGIAVGAAGGAGTYAGYQAKKHNQSKQLKQYR